MQPRQPEGAQEEAKRLPKCCLGAAYFSMGRYAAQKPPVRAEPQRRPGRDAQPLLALGSGARRRSRRRCQHLTPALLFCPCTQVCAGFAKRLKPTDDAAQLPTDSVPGGDFKCVGTLPAAAASPPALSLSPLLPRSTAISGRPFAPAPALAAASETRARSSPPLLPLLPPPLFMPSPTPGQLSLHPCKSPLPHTHTPHHPAGTCAWDTRHGTRRR